MTLIVASALAYFFIAGMKTFAVSLLREDFGVQQAVAVMLLMLVGAAALAGVIAGGRAGDRLIQRGRMNARVMVAAVAYAAGAALLAPGFLVASLPIAVVFFALGGAALAAGNAPLDAARLDIMPSFLWGRAEAVRAVLRQTAQAIAPLTFGLLADVFGNSTHRGGLRLASLVMLVTLAASAAVTWHARRSYARDVATAIASEADAGERDA